MYHHLLVYTVTLLGVFTTRWRKKPGCFLDVFFFPFVIFAGLSFRLRVAGSQSTSSFSFTLHILFLSEGGAGKFSIWYYISFTCEVSKWSRTWHFQCRSYLNYDNPVETSFLCHKSVFFLLFLHFVFTPRDIKEYLSDIRWRLFTYFCNATIFERLTRQSRVPISIC